MKPDASFLFGSKLERKLVGSILKERGKGDIHGDKDIGSKQTEPIRIKIFEGGEGNISANVNYSVRHQSKWS